MGRAILAVLLSGLVMPGLGQLFVRRLKKGGLIIAAMSLLVVSLAVALFMAFRRAVLTFGDNLPPESERWEALAKVFASQSQTVLYIIAGLMICLWLYAVVDAFRSGLAYSRELQAGEAGR